MNNPVMTVVGIRKSDGVYNIDGKQVIANSTIVKVLKPFSQQEIEKGAIGMDVVEFKMNSANYYHDYQDVQLPAEAEMVFVLDVTMKKPVTKLVQMKFKKGV